MKHYIKVTEEMGRGVHALYDLEPEKVLFTAEVLVLNEKDTKTVNTTDLQYYTFKYNETQDCLVLGDGEIFNHSPSPNIGYRLIESDGRKLMAFYTLQAVKQYEQLFIDYSSDIRVDTSKYTVNLI